MNINFIRVCDCIRLENWTFYPLKNVFYDPDAIYEGVFFLLHYELFKTYS